MELWARTGQPWGVHAANVSQKTAEFCDYFHAPTWGRLLGLAHDWGKCTPEWQQYMLNHSSKVTHSPEGASWFHQHYGCNLRALTFCIKGHHSHLPDSTTDLEPLLQHPIPPSADIPPEAMPPLAPLMPQLEQEFPKIPKPPYGYSIQQWIRMLFSSLVDADRLDAEAAETPERSARRAAFDSWETLQRRFDDHMRELAANAADTPVNRTRAKILAAALNKATCAPGFFTLHVPTGGGKTLSAMAFALKHRQLNQQRRIIMTIPFTSIIEQTAETYKKIFSDINVLEHHSNFDPGKDKDRYDTATENWDMPIVVTTNVQFFESLLKSGASVLRKAHNIAGSVIILDEAQTLPVENFQALLTTLRILVEQYRCTVVLCSATQPALQQAIRIREQRYDGIPAPTPIIDRPEELEAALSRTRIYHNGTSDLEQLAARLDAEPQVLCIVNTRKRCLDLRNRLQHPNSYHLSASMCPQERSELLAEIREKLAAQEPIAIVSTQLIEAGVDIDVATVYREQSGLDSIIQAAGRCNREGKNPDKGIVHIFDLGNQGLAGSLKTSYQCTGELLTPGAAEQKIDAELIHRYFRNFYGKFPTADKAGFQPLLGNPKTLQFNTFSKQFQMIDNETQLPLIVHYGEGAKLIEELFDPSKPPTRALFRKLQRYTVNIPKSKMAELLRISAVRQEGEFYIQVQADLYRKGYGVIAENE